MDIDLDAQLLPSLALADTALPPCAVCSPLLPAADESVRPWTALLLVGRL